MKKLDVEKVKFKRTLLEKEQFGNMLPYKHIIFFIFISKKIILKNLKKTKSAQRVQRREQKKEKKRRKQEHKRNQQKTNYKEEN